MESSSGRLNPMEVTRSIAKNAMAKLPLRGVRMRRMGGTASGASEAGREDGGEDWCWGRRRGGSGASYSAPRLCSQAGDSGVASRHSSPLDQDMPATTSSGTHRRCGDRRLLQRRAARPGRPRRRCRRRWCRPSRTPRGRLPGIRGGREAQPPPAPPGTCWTPPPGHPLPPRSPPAPTQGAPRDQPCKLGAAENCDTYER